MTKTNRKNLKNAIRVRGCKSLNDIKTVIFLQRDKDRYGKFPNRQRVLDSVFNSKYHWIERKLWVDRIIDWKGDRGENFDWQCVLHNSIQKAKELKSLKSTRASGENNPGYNHGGKLSVFSDKFVGDKTKKSEAIDKMKHTKSSNDYKENTRIEYYLSKGMTQEEAEIALYERQAVGRLDKFIERYGEDEGRARWKARQEKWIESYNDKSPEEMAEINAKKAKGVKSNNIFISECEKEIGEFLNENSKELVENQFLYYSTKLDKWFSYDFRIGNKVIEYHGDYWHCNPNKYTEDFYHQQQRKTAKDIWNKDRTKKEILEENGYSLLVIWESDYKKDKQGTIQKCINFLTQ